MLYSRTGLQYIKRFSSAETTSSGEDFARQFCLHILVQLQLTTSRADSEVIATSEASPNSGLRCHSDQLNAIVRS